MPTIVNLANLKFVRWDTHFPPDQKPPQERFGASVAPVGQQLGARKLGYNVTIIDAGKAAYPLHNHHVNEEMFLILDGEGELRLGKERHRVKAGDIVACPPGGQQTAHQLRNMGTAPLKILMVSTMLDADVVEYPDSGKIGFGATTTGADGKPTRLRGVARQSDQPKYWDGE